MDCTRRLRFRLQAGVLGCALLLVAAVAANSQDPPADPPQQPHPEMRAARLSYVQGAVQVTQGNQIIADPAPVNTPLFEGAVVTTREDGQAELQLDDGSVVRLSPNSSLQITVLRQESGSGKAEVLLTSGLGYFEMAGKASDQFVTRFEDSRVKASDFTVIRVNLDNPRGEVAVFTGNAHLDRGNFSLDLHAGQSIALNSADPNQYNLAETIEPDSWDAWNADRDQDLNSQETAKTAATGNQHDSSNPAWGDLDANGNWYDVPGQGYVWSPYEAADSNWDPYGSGNWVYTPQFGYIWVSGESWGYMPYTAGYWNFYDGFGWGWTPGYGYPWWSTGGWWCNVGNRPHRYEPPHRPQHGPVRPVEPIRRGGFYQANPVLAVNRIPSVPVAGPAHAIGRAATIAGSVVEPIKPISPRAVYNHVGGTSSGRSTLGVVGPGVGGRSGYNPWANSPGTQRSTGWTIPATGNGYHPSVGGTHRAPPATPYSGGAYRAPSTSPYAGAGGIYRPSTVNPYTGAGSRPSAPAPAPRSNGGGGSAPHISSGGGAGSAPHVSSGGGGGGGSHPAPSPHK
jgi:hypothetical protein